MMKRLICLLMLLALLPVSAQAGFPPDNESDWNKTCKWRITRTTTLYSHRYTQDSWYGQEEEEAISVFTPIGTLSAGKYVIVVSSELCGKREVLYWDGGQRIGWIEEDSYTRDTITITSTTGQTYGIPRKAYGDDAAVRHILSEFYSAAEVEAFIDGMHRGGSGSSGSSGGASGGGSTSSRKRAAKQPVPAITLTESAEDGTQTKSEVALVRPGLLRSTVEKDGAEVLVSTACLSWERAGEHALAVIYAPRTGLATLWQTERGTGTLCKLKAGSVVLVLGESGKYTKVLGEGKVGYVLTAALTLCDPAAEAAEKQLAEKSALRLTATAKGRRLTWLAKGTTVMVLRVEGGWAFVEYEGYAGYVEADALRE